MFTLHELAKSLQEYIIESQSDSHNIKSLQIQRYNNLRLSVGSRFEFPNIVVHIGISEAVYNLEAVTKVSGGLGQDEKYIIKWLHKNGIVANLKVLYKNITELQQLKMGDINIKIQGEAGDVPTENYRKRKYQIPKNDMIIIDEDLMVLLENGVTSGEEFQANPLENLEMKEL